MLTETVEELRSIALAADDASGHFPAMYARVTERVQIAAASGRFDDPTRMERFAAAFAAWYVRPRSGRGTVPACWRAAFDVAGDSHLMIVQHLLLGINAHVNHDLPQVVVELAPEGGDLAGPARGLRRRERRPGRDAARGAAKSRDGLAVGEPARRRAAVSGCSTSRLAWRGAQAWNAAERLHQLPAGGATRRRGGTRPSRRGARVPRREPGRPMSWAVAIGRRLEDHDPAAVTRCLLGHLA